MRGSIFNNNRRKTEASKLRQPPGLGTLFFAELWERFGFYSIQSLLVLYLVNVFLYSDKQAYGLFSAFSALIYATPVIGGYFADRLLGFRRSIILGGILYIIGYLLLAVPYNPYFYFALSLIIWGNGFFKSSVSSLVGTLYKYNDPRRDSGFTVFYMGINIGSFLSPIICGYVAIHYGWNYAFGISGAGMIIGISHCLVGFKRLGERGLVPNKALLSRRYFTGLSLQNLLYLSIIAISFLTSLLLHFPVLVNWTLIIFGVVVMICLSLVTLNYKPEQRNKLLALLILTIFSVVFWAFYMQTFLSVTLFIERNVNRQVFGFTIPTAMFQSMNPFFIVSLSPLFAKLWLKLNKLQRNPSTPIKFVMGLLFVGCGFLANAIGINFFATAGLMGMGWVVFAFFLQTVGELSLSPIGLAAVTKLAPPKLVGMMMGVWFLALAAAYAIAGYIADLTSVPKGIHEPLITAQRYGNNFFRFGLLAIIFALILLMLSKWLNRMMAENNGVK